LELKSNLPEEEEEKLMLNTEDLDGIFDEEEDEFDLSNIFSEAEEKKEIKS